MVASYSNSKFEWDAHVSLAESLGWSSEQVLAIREDRAPEIKDLVERAVWQTTAKLLSNHDLSDTEYDEAVSHLGHAGLVDLSTLLGYYQLLALQLCIFRVGNE